MANENVIEIDSQDSSVQIVEENVEVINLCNLTQEEASKCNSEELLQLRDENKQLKAKIASSKQDQRVFDDEDSICTVFFKDEEMYYTYKDQFARLLSAHGEFAIDLYDSYKKLRVTKIGEQDNPTKKKKKRSKRKKAEVFVVDTTPSVDASDNGKVQYSCTLSVEEAGKEESAKNARKNNVPMCFNCDGEHNLRDCSLPRDHRKINRNRQQFHAKQSVSVRYHLEHDQLYAHLKPGKISGKLQEALGLQNNEIPEHVYRMRVLGYPPGWVTEINAATKTSLVLYETDGKIEKKRKLDAFNPDLIAEYPGFNIPLEKKVKDNGRSYNCPMYSHHQSKENMVKQMCEQWKRAADNLETCDMDLDVSTSEDRPQSRQTQEFEDLENLRKQRSLILEELNGDSHESSLSSSFVTLDKTGFVVDETTEGTSNDADSSCGESGLRKGSDIKKSQLGTPILQSASPYNKLPCQNKFSKDVSDVINFENLPNTTGHYDHLTGVLDRVRKALKDASQ